MQTLTQGNAGACRAFHAANVTELCLALLDKGSDPAKSFAVKTLGNLCCDRDARAAGVLADSFAQLQTPYIPFIRSVPHAVAPPPRRLPLPRQRP